MKKSYFFITTITATFIVLFILYIFIGSVAVFEKERSMMSRLIGTQIMLNKADDTVPTIKYNEEDYYNNAIWIKFIDNDSLEQHFKWLGPKDNLASYYNPSLVLDKDYALSSVKAANLDDNIQVSEIFMDLLKREDIKVVRFYSSVRSFSDEKLLPNNRTLNLYFLPKSEEEMNSFRDRLEEVPFIESASFIYSKPVDF